MKMICSECGGDGYVMVKVSQHLGFHDCGWGDCGLRKETCVDCEGTGKVKEG